MYSTENRTSQHINIRTQNSNCALEAAAERLLRRRLILSTTIKLTHVHIIWFCNKPEPRAAATNRSRLCSNALAQYEHRWAARCGSVLVLLLPLQVDIQSKRYTGKTHKNNDSKYAQVQRRDLSKNVHRHENIHNKHTELREWFKYSGYDRATRGYYSMCSTMEMLNGLTLLHGSVV